MKPPHWKLVPHLLLRRAGFPFGLIEQLAFPRSASLAAQVASLQELAATCRHELLQRRFPEEVRQAVLRGDRPALRKLSVWRRHVGHHRNGPPPAGPFSFELSAAHLRWRTALAQVDQVRAELSVSFAEEQAGAKRVLRQLLTRDDVRQALFLLVPGLLEVLDTKQRRAGDRASDRALDRRLYSFVQRLASKNETTSFFGPLTHAVVDDALTETCFGPETPSGVNRREVFAAFWAVAALAARISADPALRDELPVRRIAASGSEGELNLGPDGTPVALDAAVRTLLRAVDDRKTMVQLAQVLAVPLADIRRDTRALEKAGFVRCGLEPASTSHHPLDDLLHQLPSGPGADAWREKLSIFGELLKQFERPNLAERGRLLAEIERHFETVSGKPARRGAGQMYADRTVLFEDCEGDLTPVHLGKTDARHIEQALAPALQLGAGYGRLRHRALVDLATRVVADARGPLRFLKFAADLDARISKGELAALDGEVDAYLTTLRQRVVDANEGRVSRLRIEDLADLLSVDQGPRFASPDVMLERRPGCPPRVVIGEVHPYVFAWGSQGYFAPNAEALRSAFDADLSPWGGKTRIAVVLRRRRHKGLVTDAFPGTFIEVTGRSGVDPARRVAVADLRVRLDALGVPELFGPGGPLTLYVGEDDHPHLRVFAPPLVEMPPVRLGSHTPRIEIGTLVFQRERWDVPRDSELLSPSADPVALMIAVAALRTREGWPRFIFLSAPSEPKPLCLDLEVPQAQSHLQRLTGAGRITVVEMLPAPDALWLQRSAGPHTSELRLGMLRSN